MSELVRANKVTVKADASGKYVAEFYRTHKKLETVAQDSTDWKALEGMTKTGERESFRAYVIQNAETLGILWKPEDMRDASNVRLPKYSEDAVLMAEAVAMVKPDIAELVGKCKYGVTMTSVEAERIIPKTKTSKGIALSGLGIEGGKYKNSGNWAWADIEISVTMGYKEDEIYYTAMVELVSGQLKKPKLTITSFNEYVKGELITAGLATEEELDPSKESKQTEESAPKVEDTTAQEDMVAEGELGMEPEEVQAQDTPQEEVVEDSAETVENKSGRRRTLGKNK